MLRIFDADERLTDMGKIEKEPGASIKLVIAPAPNSALFLEVSGYGSSAGAYTLQVPPQKAFDNYEPNDDIFNAPPHHAGREDRRQHHG